MTLIVATDESDEGFSASQTISELMREHPSRSIVLAVSEESGGEPEARVLAQCWKPFGKGQQICCEQIEVKARAESWPKVGPILLGLIAADLPVVFWCRHGAAFASAADEQKSGLESVIDLATKSILDSRGIDPALAFERFASWKKGGHIVADLEWARLTGWREPLGHIFDNVARENVFSNFHTIEISYADDKPTTGAFYAAGWLSATYRARVTFHGVKGYGPGLHSIVLKSDSETITFARTGSECTRIYSTSGPERRYNYADPTVEALMTEELSITGIDPAFESAFGRAQELLSEYR